MKKKKILLIIFYSFLSTFLFSQNYQVIDTSDYKKRELLIKEIDSDFKSVKKQLKKKYKGKVRKKIEEYYSLIHKDFTKNIRKKKLIFNSDFPIYIDSLTNLVIKSNPTLINEKLKVYITKHNTPNALSMGNGFILMHMGLFKYLENEAQITSVLCHEIAHQLLEHSQKNILNKIKLETSKKSKNQVKKIKKNKYKKQSEAFSALKKILYSDSKLHRIQEQEADSLGFILYKNTKYNNIDFTKSLAALIKFDTLPNIQLIQSTYKTFFNLPEQPFKEDWLKIENFNSYNYNHYKEKINKDSLKSHPELKNRIKYLKEKFKADFFYEEIQINNSKFKALKKKSFLEDVANLSYLEKYGLSIYLTLYKLERNPKNSYLKKWLGNNFKKLYDAKKKYQFNRHVDRIIPKEQDKSYQQFLSFLWNLNLKEIKIIADYYQ
ncbi:M48 family metalloprotease [Tenacibaculum sp. S7007]|uniref:M48 family metalloprotease n=1 Tax=Tenacibaculum pelagium TaxID=2759527 RepID=A0A839AQ77_9FLAO|nr:M48 family metalloprotease [Tenacibaculum pelagium]MBA6156540.1 M48 family metalloprotease [Tenacibaculum pelagium]